MEVNSNFTDKAKRDYELVMRALNDGDQKAYAELMNYYNESIYFMMLKMTKDPTDAEDLTIEAFGKAFRSLSQYTPDFAFSTWLFKIASNNCIDYIRKKRLTFTSIDRTADDYEESFAHNIPSKHPDPEEAIILKQKYKALREIVDKLKPHYKKLVEFRYYKEYSYEEISEELKLPLGTVKAQLFRARDLLGQIVKKKQDSI
ncbi:MAG: sigma-70 family RNA polymerase sigma factor [Bacteroidales bacterium]|nr:sigma-70 family RNA polymerase sigma factor [Bacteroidales bacterium]